MLALLLLSASGLASSSDVLNLCKPVLARKAGGEISTISVTWSHPERRGWKIGGRMTAFLGMGPPAPGSASAHHLIRAEFSFRCRVRKGRVSEAAVNPLRQ